MNKKQLMIATMAALLSVTTVQATNITGVTGVGNVYDINPLKSAGTIGYRQYQDFDLSQGDIANLIFTYGGKNLESFVNLVDNKININGIVNTMRGGNFYNGHAVFISPNGMTVGSHGVLNVGTLSVLTPDGTTYGNLKTGYNTKSFDEINNLSQLRKQHGGNADVNIAGKVFTRGSVNVNAKNINVSGNIFNGVPSTNQLTSEAAATTLFNSLVNTDGIPANNLSFGVKEGTIVLKSDNSTGSMNITGGVYNMNKGELAITNKGSLGLAVDGKVYNKNGNLNINNQAGNMTVGGTVANLGGTLAISNAVPKSDTPITNSLLTIKDNAKLTSSGEVQVVNKGRGGMVMQGDVTSTTGRAALTNYAGDMDIQGTVTADKNIVRIENRGGQLKLSPIGKLQGNTVYVKNTGTGGMLVNGTVSSASKINMLNENGHMQLDGATIKTTNGVIAIENRGTGQLQVKTGTKIQGNGSTSLTNKGTRGLAFDEGASITNAGGETAVNNYAGTMTIAGNIDVTGGNLGVINRTGATEMTLANTSVIKNKGHIINVRNYGNGAMTLDGTIENSAPDFVAAGSTNQNYIVIKNLGEAGGMNIRGTVKNRGGQTAINNYKGKMYISSTANIDVDNNLGILNRADADNMEVATGAQITNSGKGFINIKNWGKADATTGNGMDFNATVTSKEGDIAINNYKGNMFVGGNVTATKGNMGIINRAGGANMTLAASNKLNVNGNANIKNDGSGNLVVNNEITHTGRVNVLGNNGSTTLGGKVHNNSNGKLDDNNGFYAVSRKNGTGMTVTSNFTGDGNGLYLIKNISGNNGLKYDGAITSGTMAEVYNMKGNMTAGGTLEAPQAVVLNKGNGLTVNGTLKGADVKVVNKGSTTANITNATVLNADGTQKTTRWFWEELK